MDHGLVERTGGTTKAETAYRWHFNSTAMLDAALYGFDDISTSIDPTRLWAARRRPN